jgi:hypothetical protein
MAKFKKDYSIFFRIERTLDSKITELTEQGDFAGLRKLIINSGLSDELSITEDTSNSDTIKNIIINVFKHTSEMEKAGVNRPDFAALKHDLYNVYDSIAEVDDEILLAGSDYLLQER